MFPAMAIIAFGLLLSRVTRGDRAVVPTYTKYSLERRR